MIYILSSSILRLLRKRIEEKDSRLMEWGFLAELDWWFILEIGLGVFLGLTLSMLMNAILGLIQAFPEGAVAVYIAAAAFWVIVLLGLLFYLGHINKPPKKVGQRLDAWTQSMTPPAPTTCLRASIMVTCQ
jgi:hypothetical protein